jgi:hypothetical protein
MPWPSWHCFRRTHTTLANELGMAFTDRMAMMGHSEARMTALYTVNDLQRRRTFLDQMADRLLSGLQRRWECPFTKSNGR